MSDETVRGLLFFRMMEAIIAMIWCAGTELQFKNGGVYKNKGIALETY